MGLFGYVCISCGKYNNFNDDNILIMNINVKRAGKRKHKAHPTALSFKDGTYLTREYYPLENIILLILSVRVNKSYYLC